MHGGGGYQDDLLDLLDATFNTDPPNHPGSSTEEVPPQPSLPTAKPDWVSEYCQRSIVWTMTRKHDSIHAQLQKIRDEEDASKSWREVAAKLDQLEDDEERDSAKHVVFVCQF